MLLQIPRSAGGCFCWKVMCCITCLPPAPYHCRVCQTLGIRYLIIFWTGQIFAQNRNMIIDNITPSATQPSCPRCHASPLKVVSVHGHEHAWSVKLTLLNVALVTRQRLHPKRQTVRTHPRTLRFIYLGSRYLCPLRFLSKSDTSGFLIRVTVSKPVSITCANMG